MTHGRQKRTPRSLAIKPMFMLLCVSSFGPMSIRAQSQPVQAAPGQEELVQRTQQLFNAIAIGDHAPWQRYLSDDVIYVDEQGTVMDKATFLANLKPLPNGYTGTILIAKPNARYRPGVAVLSYEADETETVFGQVIHARYHTVDTWTVKEGEWQITASQTVRYYEDPTAASISEQVLADYVGTYQLAPGTVMKVWRDGNTLYAQRGSGQKYKLLPESPDLFFHAGVEGRRLFHRDASGHVTMLIDRRNNEDLIWKKIN